MKKNNDGFTIVELIVVIAMLVIFIGAVSVSEGLPAMMQKRDIRRSHLPLRKIK